MSRARALLTTGLLAGSLVLAPAAQAAPAPVSQTAPPAVSPFAGDGTANLLAVDASVAGQPVVDLDLAPADTAVDTSADPRSTGRVANLDAALLGAIDLSGILSEAEQSAPPDNPEPLQANLLDVPASPLLDLQVANARTHARWPGDDVCLAPGEPIVQSFSEVAAADVLTIEDLGGSLVSVVNDLGGTVATQSTITTETVDGQVGRALQSTSETQITSVTLFGGTPLEVRVDVLSTPTLTATATGAPGGATVDFVAPVLNIVTPDDSSIPSIPLINLVPQDELGGVIDTVTDGLEEAVQATLGDAGIAAIDFLIGEETVAQAVAPDGTSAAGTAAAIIIDIEILAAAGDPLVDATIAIAPMSASTAVPVGGIICPPPTPPENPLRQLHKDVSQADVAPGGQFTYTLTVPNAAECTLTDVVVTDVVDAPPGTTVTADPAPASNDNETLVWNVAEIAPLDAATFTLTVSVPDDAPVGFTFEDTLTATGTCDGHTATQTVVVDHPTVTDEFIGGCDLSVSNKSASHLEVVPGQAFNYFVHAFNQGASPCTAVDVADTLDDRLTFVSCSDGCTNQGQVVNWTGKTIGGGSGLTLTVTARVRDDATGRLANAAIITSPDDDTPTTVTHDGPQISEISVLAPPNPPELVALRLPRTGGTMPTLLVLGLGGLGAASLVLRRRLQMS